MSYPAIHLPRPKRLRRRFTPAQLITDQRQELLGRVGVALLASAIAEFNKGATILPLFL